MEKIQIAPDLEICRILNGMWQVSGTHGQIDGTLAINDMLQYHEHGFTTWDLADIYGPAESLIGKFRDRAENFEALTKFVPNPGPMSYSIVSYHIEQSLQKMKTDCLDMVQFHWWDYSDPSYLDAMKNLTRLQSENKIKHIGLTNFDTERVKIMIDNGYRPVSNQVQYSILDCRPEKIMAPYFAKNGMYLLTYGTLLGGFFSEKYLESDEPTRAELNTASLQKYKNMIDAWGGWELFQELLSVLDDIAKRHETGIVNVATRYILDKPQVAGVIVGARLGISNHIAENSKTFDLRLDSDDISQIHGVTSKANDLYDIIGDCGDEYR